MSTGTQQGRGFAWQEGAIARDKARDSGRQSYVFLLVVQLVKLVDARRSARRAAAGTTAHAATADDDSLFCWARRPEPRHGLQPDYAVLRQSQGVERLGQARRQPREPPPQPQQQP